MEVERAMRQPEQGGRHDPAVVGEDDQPGFERQHLGDGRRIAEPRRA